MDRRRLGIVLLALASALAGCTQAPPPPPEEPAPEAEAPEEGLVPAAELANVTAQESEGSEFARSLDEKFHTHNYWGGSLEKLLMDEDVVSSSMTPQPTAGVNDLAEYAIVTLISGGPGATPFQLPEGSIVPPEATRLEVTITWASSPTITGLSLAYQTAAAEPPEGDEGEDPSQTQFLEPLPEGGGTYTIATNVTANDIPHTTLSRWRFWLLPENNLAGWAPRVFNGTAHVTIKAFRDDALYVAPPHPDFWGARQSVRLFEANETLAGNRALVPVVLEGDGDGIAFVAPPENVTVPPHTALLTVTLNYTNGSPLPDVANTHLELYYVSAAAFDWVAAEPASVQPGSIVYTIPVDNRMVDSPYATLSQWAFRVAIDSDAPTDQGPFLGDVAFFDGSFLLTVVVDRETV